MNAVCSSDRVTLMDTYQYDDSANDVFEREPYCAKFLLHCTGASALHDHRVGTPLRVLLRYLLHMQLLQRILLIWTLILHEHDSFRSEIWRDWHRCIIRTCQISSRQFRGRNGETQKWKLYLILKSKFLTDAYPLRGLFEIFQDFGKAHDRLTVKISEFAQMVVELCEFDLGVRYPEIFWDACQHFFL